MKKTTVVMLPSLPLPSNSELLLQFWSPKIREGQMKLGKIQVRRLRHSKEWKSERQRGTYGLLSLRE